jgi:hypothetical protein
VLGPVFGSRLVQLSEGPGPLSLSEYQAGFKPLLWGVLAAIILACLLRETGPAVRKPLETW